MLVHDGAAVLEYSEMLYASSSAAADTKLGGYKGMVFAEMLADHSIFTAALRAAAMRRMLRGGVVGARESIATDCV